MQHSKLSIFYVDIFSTSIVVFFCIRADMEFVTGTTGMPVYNSIGLGKMFG